MPAESSGPDRVYDLVQDPTECNNCIDDPLYDAVMTSMLSRIDAFLSAS